MRLKMVALLVAVGSCGDDERLPAVDGGQNTHDGAISDVMPSTDGGNIMDVGVADAIVLTQCQGITAVYSTADVPAISFCRGWKMGGMFELIPVAQTIRPEETTAGVCALICHRSDGSSVLPVSCSGTWDGATGQFGEWTSDGCQALPVSGEAGCNWDRTCDNPPYP